MTRALLGWFGRRRALLVGALLLAAGAGAWSLRRTCATHRCPRAAVPTARIASPAVGSAEPNAPEARAHEPTDETKPTAKRKLRAPWVAQCQERLLAARRELTRHDPIFDDGVVETSGHDYVRYALGLSSGLNGCFQPAEFCEACASVGAWPFSRKTSDWQPSASIPSSRQLVRVAPNRMAYLDLPWEGLEGRDPAAMRKVFEPVMKRALEDCLAMNDRDFLGKGK